MLDRRRHLGTRPLLGLHPREQPQEPHAQAQDAAERCGPQGHVRHAHERRDALGRRPDAAQGAAEEGHDLVEDGERRDQEQRGRGHMADEVRARLHRRHGQRQVHHRLPGVHVSRPGPRRRPRLCAQARKGRRCGQDRRQGCRHAVRECRRLGYVGS